jgi:hypothetical protein
MQAFQIKVAFAVENKGPDETDVQYHVWFAFPQDCVGPPDSLFGEIDMIVAKSVVPREGSANFTCPESLGGPRTIDLAVAAYGSASDLDTYDNALVGQVVVNVVGTSSSPTPTPVIYPLVPTEESGGEATAGSAQANPTAPSAVLAAAALPRTGQPPADSQPNSLTFVIVGTALGLAAATALAIQRRTARRG